MRKGYKGYIDADNREMKLRFLAWFGRMTGVLKVSVEPKRTTRSLRQNAWWHACVVRPYFDYAREQGQPDFKTPDEAHYDLAARVLGVDVKHDPLTGEFLYALPRPTHTLGVEDFADFADRSRHYLLDTFGIVTMDPDPDYAAKRPIRSEVRQCTTSN